MHEDRLTRAVGVTKAALVAATMLMAGGAAGADVFHMGSGLTSLEFVTVGHPGNAGVLSGAGAGGLGPDRTCGAVDYTYGIGKYEVTAGQYTQFLNAAARTDPYGLYSPAMATGQGCGIQRAGVPGSYTYTADHPNVPVDYVCWGCAARLCNWLTSGNTETGSYALDGRTSNADLLAVEREPGARFVIPSEDEWFKAAYFDPETGTCWQYATGNAVPGNEPPAGANYWVGDGVSWPMPLTDVGAYGESPSPWGTFDQSGNVFEWTEEVVYLYDQPYYLFRGGSWYCTSPIYLDMAARDHRGPPDDEKPMVGLRLALVPEPATLALVALGGLAALGRRRR